MQETGYSLFEGVAIVEYVQEPIEHSTKCIECDAIDVFNPNCQMVVMVVRGRSRIFKKRFLVLDFSSL